METMMEKQKTKKKKNKSRKKMVTMMEKLCTNQ